jgi:hypothetical protein
MDFVGTIKTQNRKKKYHPANCPPPFSMTSKVVLNKFEFLNMLDHLRGCSKLRPSIHKQKKYDI